MRPWFLLAASLGACAAPSRPEPRPPLESGHGESVRADAGAIEPVAPAPEADAAAPVDASADTVDASAAAPRDATGPGAGASAERGIELVYAGAPFTTSFPLDLGVRVVGSTSEHRLTIHYREWVTQGRCNACTTTHMPAEPPPDAFKQGALQAGRMLFLPGRPLTAIGEGKCRDGFACFLSVPVPPGEYRVVVDGPVRCAEVRVRVPIVSHVTVPCTR